MRLHLLGARGMFGSHALRAWRARGWDVRGADLPEVDITSPASVDGFFRRERSETVVNAAAFTDVDGAESREEEALRVNGEAVALLARAAREYGAFLVHISTDYVFPGDRSEGYEESHPPGPAVNAYGRSKLAGERALEEVLSPERVLLARTQWLYGPGGKNFVDTIAALALSGRDLQVVDDQWGVPTHVGDLADQLAWCLEEGVTGTVHAVGGGGPVTWHTVAAAITEALGRPAPRPCDSDAFPRPAPRPRHGWLRNRRIPSPPVRHWRESLERHLADHPPERKIT